MAHAWYYRREKKSYGPLSGEQLQGLIDSGQVTPDDLVWREGMAKALPARQIRGLVRPRAGATTENDRRADVHVGDSPRADPVSVTPQQKRGIVRLVAVVAVVAAVAVFAGLGIIAAIVGGASGNNMTARGKSETANNPPITSSSPVRTQAESSAEPQSGQIGGALAENGPDQPATDTPAAGMQQTEPTASGQPASPPTSSLATDASPS